MAEMAQQAKDAQCFKDVREFFKILVGGTWQRNQFERRDDFFSYLGENNPARASLLAVLDEYHVAASIKLIEKLASMHVGRYLSGFYERVLAELKRWVSLNCPFQTEFYQNNLN